MKNKNVYTIRALLGACILASPHPHHVADVAVIACYLGMDALRESTAADSYWPPAYARAYQWASAAVEHLPDWPAPTGSAAVYVTGEDFKESVRNASPILTVLARTGDAGAQRLLYECDAIADLTAGSSLDEIAELLE